MAAAALTTSTEKMPMRKVQMEERRKHHHFLVWRHSTWSPITGPIAPVSITVSPTDSVLMLRPGLTPSSSHLVEWLLKDWDRFSYLSHYKITLDITETKPPSSPA